METYSFTVQVDGINLADEPYEDRLYEAGADDALVSVIENILFVDFDRQASSFESAVASARETVGRAGGRIVSVLPL